MLENENFRKIEKKKKKKRNEIHVYVHRVLQHTDRATYKYIENYKTLLSEIFLFFFIQLPLTISKNNN